MTPIDMTKIYKKYAGMWVALDKSRTKALATGKTAKEALQAAKKQGIRNPIITKIPTENFGYIL
jgi:hypothetical protein